MNAANVGESNASHIQVDGSKMYWEVGTASAVHQIIEAHLDANAGHSALKDDGAI